MSPNQISLLVSKELHARLKQRAKAEGRLLKVLVEQLLLDALKNRKAA